MSTQRNDTLLDYVLKVLPENIYKNSRVLALAFYRKKKAQVFLLRKY